MCFSAILYYEGGVIMGSVYAEVTLKNAVDVGALKRKIIKKEEIRQITVKALVDTGAPTLIINETIRQKLGLELCGAQPVRMANGVKETVKIVEPVEIHWENRKMTCQPRVLPGARRNILGLIPLEDMDLMVDPTTQVLIGAHGKKAIEFLVGLQPE
jgi:clan AA aspartic protease